MDLSPDDEDFTGRLLHQAALWDNIELLLELVSTGADVDARDTSCRVALHAAALAERSACLVALCGAGAFVDAVSDGATGGKTPLHLAAERGHAENVRVLLERGADVTLRDSEGRTARALAERGGHKQTAAILAVAEDALERERLGRLQALRELVVKGDAAGLKTRLLELGKEAGLIVNLAPGGANTLLYIASEAGNTPIVKVLLEYGADGRAHPVTKYCPLYIACYRGHRETAEQLLAHFPEAVQQETVERWLPLHAACIGGHASLVTLLLDYKYPEHLLNIYKTSKGVRYQAAFNVNSCDASGHTALHVAATLGNVAIVKTLLGHTVQAIDDEPSNVPEELDKKQKQQLVHRKGLSSAIHAIVTKLTSGISNKPTTGIRAIDLTSGSTSVVSAAVSGGHVTTLQLLLEAGADPNAVATMPSCLVSNSTRSRSSPSSADGKSDRDTEWTALAVAAQAGQLSLVRALVGAGARDPRGLALAQCRGHSDILALILTTRAYVDPEFKVNRAAITDAVFNGKNDSLTYNALCPASPIALNWRDLPNVEQIQMSWISQSCSGDRAVSPTAALRALVRLDLAGGSLTSIPHELFSLCSLRYLNVAQNKLETLPIGPNVYTAPVLQDLYLQDNRLESLPPAVFQLQSLTTLDVSNNKLRQLPSAMWTARKLRELNASLNLLRDLPTDWPTDEATSPGVASRRSLSHAQSCFGSQSTSSSRSPSIEQGSEADDEDLPAVGERSENANSSEIRAYHSWPAGAERPERSIPAGSSGAALTQLNLSHNRLTHTPAALACRAASLHSLNLSYNCLRSMSYITSYPSSLRQLDLSHNQITCWFSLPQIDNFSGSEDPLACYCEVNAGVSGRRPRSGSVRSQLMSAACVARRHLRLDSLRTLILSNNLLTRIQLATDDDGSAEEEDLDRGEDIDNDDWGGASGFKTRLMFPLLSMLDVSRNLLRSVPRNVHTLTNLAVLNLSGNKDLTTLPPQLGLLTRLWSLNLSECGLVGPLARVAACPARRSGRVLAHLRTLLYEASGMPQPRLALLGDQGIGKTTLLECLRQESPPGFRKKSTDHWTKRMGNKTSAKGNISTVGVDVGNWVYERARAARGHVTFRTWDFGGQREYYATHQYFLSRRTLYLVLWKASEGRKSLTGAVDWLRSIQCRAPGSPVIMVATHYDQVPSANLPESESPEALQRYIRSEIMAAPDADKLGLPRVLDSVEVSCSTKHNIKILADIIYTAAFSIKAPGSKEPLLEERIPASYAHLEECVAHYAAELKAPVVTRDEYKRLVTQYFQQKGYKMFRDSAELHQATIYLHENGVLLHYDDATLKELYFLSPQWLCDVLAHVVTIKEINPFAANGIMKLEDLTHVLKASPLLANGEEASSLALSLLNKFELALSWDTRSLLVPPLLPESPPSQPQLLLKTRGAGGGKRWTAAPNRQTDSPTLIMDPIPTDPHQSPPTCTPRRFVLMSYSPRGFWARLTCRLLADDLATPLAGKEPSSSWAWSVWRTGLCLTRGGVPVLSVRETNVDELNNTRFSVLSDGYWCQMDPNAGACIEIALPEICNNAGTESKAAVQARLLAIISDHIDLLLEDWYPSLGTRFVHTSEGRCLITRISPCPYCLKDPAPRGDLVENIDEDYSGLSTGSRVRLSHESRASDVDSGVGADSSTSSRLGSRDRSPLVEPYIVYGWTFEQCVLYGRKLTCPVHKEVDGTIVSPDTLLLDIDPTLMFTWDSMTITCVLGRGAFGTVLGGRGPRGERLAVKALQPAQPPRQAANHYHHAYKAALSRWEREGAVSAGRAYCALRQEIAIMSLTRHSHVASLAGVCRDPLALLLPAAPMGSLDACLRALRTEGGRLGPRVVRLIALQMARALEYLHAKKIVYRDLKSENVLVWSLPKPHEVLSAERSRDAIDVHVKLGDYGISRLALPSGTKGFGGTEGFMAPEIMRYNGEEEYNEKVDCFSYGMLLYEILTLRQPFEGHEAVKDAILEGVRPPLTAKELQYPCNITETIAVCWRNRASSRPSAAALAAVCAASELAALQCAAQTNSHTPQVVCCGPVASVEEYETGGWEIYRGEGGRVHTMLATSTGFATQHTFAVPPDKDTPVEVTAMCRVRNKLWLADDAGRILVYSVPTLCISWIGALWSCVGGGESPCVALQPLPHIQRVAVALNSGRLFLVSSERPEADASFVLTELGTATSLSCLAALPTDYGYELWCGGSGLYSYKLSSAGVKGAAETAGGEVTLLAAADGKVAAVFQDNPSSVEQWSSSDPNSRLKLDCSRLMPHSESLQSIELDDEELKSRHLEVTSLLLFNGHVYLGTAWGCVVVAESERLRPVTVFRPHEATVWSILPLAPHRSTEWWPSVATLGAGYRPLLPRFVPQSSSTKSHAHDASATESYCLLWRANRWLPD